MLNHHRLSPIVFLFLLFSLTGCCQKVRDFSRFGADEFVIDSYKIKEGKLAILEMQGIPLEEVPCEAMYEFKDVIDENDTLIIAVYHPTRKDLMESIQFINDTVGGFRVNNGRVDLPDIPPVLIAGLTLEEARIKIQNEFRNQIRDTEVFVNYKMRRAKKVELTGLVATDAVPVDGRMRLYEVIAHAKIPPNANFYNSYVVRDGCQLGIDLHKLIHEGDMSQNIVMRGGDKIFIAAPSDSLVMVMGEVGLPKPVEVPYGFISLREALVSAHGIPFTGDKRNIQVIRGNLPCPKIYTLCWEHIIHLPNDSLLLIPGDTVYVSETPLTRWNRFIDQLLPSVTGIQAGYGLYRLTN
ncbi:polysaccharide biosynthesis/export family protein [Criblamydia sequanensis]|uniref:Capsule polysaccharide export protein n=1 Tax=Candidatus Criblamydia sequanensis CRIB-18 TaxID=1437425 RepID=A0A090E0F9_9BACT|nr:polysaccharide biosynthesis/export family protein [Criblamydia sequanensis]CDR34299.1 Putative capsule polysaccharide export protein [Criblamydia sequanensis CRIB-18]